MQLGSNDLTNADPLHVGSAIDDFFRLLHDAYNVQVICVCRTLMRQDKLAYNCKAKKLTKYLRVVLETVTYANFRGHRGFRRPSKNVYLRDGVHLNSLGQDKFYRSLRGAILGGLSLITVPTHSIFSVPNRALIIYVPRHALLFCCDSLFFFYVALILISMFYYGCTQCYYSSIELLFAFSAFDSTVCTGDGLIFVS